MKKIKWFYPFDIIVIAYAALSIGLSRIYDFRIDYACALDLRYDKVFFKLVFYFFLGYAAFLSVRFRFYFPDIWRRLREKFLNLSKMYEFLHIMICLKLVLLIYCNIKQAIPIIHPAIYDEALIKCDRFVHFGINPNTFLVSLIKSPHIAAIIDKSYFAWYALKAPVLCFFIFFVDRKKTVHFFSAYFLLWIIGGLAAVAVPSWGPVYYRFNWFEQMHSGIPIAKSLQLRLWAHYSALLDNPGNYKVFIYEGIAAIPALHVGVVALYAIFLKSISRALFCLMLAYTIMIQIGSVYLGWHYAIDGYLCVMIAFIAYYAGRLFAKISY